MILQVVGIPSSNQTWQLNIPELNGGFNGKINELNLNGGFSSTPCLITRGYDWAYNVKIMETFFWATNDTFGGSSQGS
jgi:hypothetical protein